MPEVIALKTELNDCASFLDLHTSFYPKGTWLHFAAFLPDSTTGAKHKCFRPDDREAQLKWIKQYRNARNIYLTFNPLRTRRNAKPRKSHIACVIGAYVDADPGSVETQTKDLKRIKSHFEKFEPMPSVLINSGRGMWGYWYFKEPIWLDFGQINPMTKDSAEKEEINRICAPAESTSKKLRNAFPGGDPVQNVDRLTRLVGTTWFPTEKKREAGWIEPRPIPAPIRMEALTYEPADIVADINEADKVIESSMGDLVVMEDYDLKDTPLIRAERDDIKSGNALDFPKKNSNEPDWSRFGASKVSRMLAAGMSNAEIAAICLNSAYNVSKHYLRESDPIRAVKRAIELGLKGNRSLLIEFNKKYCAVMAGGKARAAWFEKDDADSELLILANYADLKKHYQNRMIGKNLNPATWWLNHSERHTRDRIVFKPAGNESFKELNIWRGWWKLPSKTGSCSLFLDHLLENVAGGNQNHFVYIFAWFAQIRQQPAVRPGVALALRGGQGTGKSAVFETFGKCLAPYYLSISDKSELVGQFTSHLANKILVFADEAIFAADRSITGRLKYLITQPRQKLEKKFNDAVYIANYVRLGVASNHDWAVPADLDDRRFAVFDIPDNGQKNNRAYFGPIFCELEEGGYEKLIHTMETFDLDQVDLTNIPTTSARNEQRLHSVRTHVQWWYDVLTTEEISVGNDGAMLLSDTQPLPIKDVFEAYENFAKAQSDRHPIPRTELGKWIKKMCPSRTRSRQSVGVRQRKSYSLPDIGQARAEFAEFVQMNVDELFPDQWDQEEGASAQEEQNDDPL